MKTKICTKCKQVKVLSKFVKDSTNKDNLWAWCKTCQKKQRDIWQMNNIKKNPWYHSYNNAKGRCNNVNNKNYRWWGAKGIKFLLTKDEMKFPTIDRKNNTGDYTFDNCQFLENKDNSLKDNIGHTFKGKYIKYYKIGQYTSDGKLIKIWNSQGEASLQLNIDQGTISKAIKYGYIRYKFLWKQEKLYV